MRSSSSLIIVGMLCACSSADAQQLAAPVSPAGPPVYVIAKRSMLFKDSAGAVVTSIPLDKSFGYLIVETATSKASNTIYVLNARGKARTRSLSAVDVATRRVARVIDVGSGEQAKLLMSADGRRLFCYAFSGTSRYDFSTPESLPSPNLSVGHGRPPTTSKPHVSVIDTATNEVIATYDWWSGVVAALHEPLSFSNRFFATRDGTYFVAQTAAFTRGAAGFGFRETGQLISIFSGQSAAPTATVDPQGMLRALLLSADEKSLVLVGERNGAPSGLLDIVNLETGNVIRTDPGGKIAATMFSKAGDSLPAESGASLIVAVERPRQPSGVLSVVDVVSGRIASHDLADQPTRLIRLGPSQGMWVLGEREMRSVSESGVLGDKPILLNDKTGGGAFLNGFPGETIGLGEEHAAILIADKGGASRHQVALLDLKQLNVDGIVETMSASQRAGIRTGRFLKSAALVMALPTTMAYLATPNLGFANEALAARPDGRVLYVLDTDTHDVTVVAVDTATIEERIPVDKSVTRLLVLPDGKHLACIGKITQNIDLDSNKMD